MEGKGIGATLARNSPLSIPTDGVAQNWVPAVLGLGLSHLATIHVLSALSVWQS